MVTVAVAVAAVVVRGLAVLAGRGVGQGTGLWMAAAAQLCAWPFLARAAGRGFANPSRVVSASPFSGASRPDWTRPGELKL